MYANPNPTLPHRVGKRWHAPNRTVRVRRNGRMPGQTAYVCYWYYLKHVMCGLVMVRSQTTVGPFVAEHPADGVWSWRPLSTSLVS